MLGKLIRNDIYFGIHEPDIDFIKNDELYRIYEDDLPIVVVALGTSIPKGGINDIIQYMLPFAIYSIIGNERKEQAPMYAELPVEFSIQKSNREHVEIVALDPNNPEKIIDYLTDIPCIESAGQISLKKFLENSRAFSFTINKNNIMWVVSPNRHRRSFSLPWQGGIESALFEKYRAEWRREHGYD